MPKSKSKVATPAATSDATTNVSPPSGKAGFYKKSGDRLLFAPTKVHLPGGGTIEVSKHTEYNYPVEGWTYHESAEAAYAAEDLELPAVATRESIAEKIAARKAMTFEQKESERAQRDAEHISRLQEKHPDKAAQLQKKLEERATRSAQRAALAALPPEERKAARRAEIESKHPELAAKRQAMEEKRAARLAARRR